jgi:hypothetical protein
MSGLSFEHLKTTHQVLLLLLLLLLLLELTSPAGAPHAQHQADLLTLVPSARVQRQQSKIHPQ